MRISGTKSLKRLFRLFGLDLSRVPPYAKYAWLGGQSIRTVLDVGAHTGQFTAQMHLLLPEATIYAFEPLRDCYERLATRMASMPQLSAFNYALGDADATVEMYRSEFAPSSSILPMEQLHSEAFPHTKSVAPEHIVVKRLDDVVQELDIRDNVLVKVDVQGFEDRVIAGGMKTISQAHVLIIETSFRPLYRGQVLFDVIFDVLRPMGFSYMGSEDPVRNPRDGSVLQCDSVFVKGVPLACAATS